MSKAKPRSPFLRGLLIFLYLVVAGAFILIALEFAARLIGLGEPIVYYNAAQGGMRPLPNQHVQRIGGAWVTIDENGFRSARPSKPGSFSILYIGDSVTWGGTKVDDRDLFSEIAADALRAEGREVYAMNAGVNGAAILNQEEIFSQYANAANAVVWIFPWPDMRRTYATVGPLYPASFRPRFALVEAIDNVLFRFWLPAFREIAPKHADDFAMPNFAAGYEKFMEGVIEDRVETNLAAAREILAAADSLNLPLLVGITPLVEDGRLRPLDAEASEFLKEAAQAGAIVFDVRGAFERASEDGRVDEYFVDIVHYSKAGNRVVGESLGKVLRELP